MKIKSVSVRYDGDSDYAFQVRVGVAPEDYTRLEAGLLRSGMRLLNSKVLVASERYEPFTLPMTIADGDFISPERASEPDAKRAIPNMRRLSDYHYDHAKKIPLAYTAGGDLSLSVERFNRFARDYQLGTPMVMTCYVFPDEPQPHITPGQARLAALGEDMRASRRRPRYQLGYVQLTPAFLQRFYAGQSRYLLAPKEKSTVVMPWRRDYAATYIGMRLSALSSARRRMQRGATIYPPLIGEMYDR